MLIKKLPTNFIIHRTVSQPCKSLDFLISKMRACKISDNLSNGQSKKNSAQKEIKKQGMKKHWSEVIPFVTYSDFQPKIRKPVMSSGPKPLHEPAISATNYSTLKSRNFLFFFFF